MALSDDFPAEAQRASGVPAFIASDSRSISPTRRRLAEINAQIATIEAERDVAQQKHDELAPMATILADLVTQHQTSQKALLGDGVDAIDYSDALFRTSRIQQKIAEYAPRVDLDALKAAAEALTQLNGRLGHLVAQRDEATEVVVAEAAEAFLEQEVIPQTAKMLQYRAVVDALGPRFARMAAERIAAVGVERPDPGVGWRFREELIKDPSAELTVPTEPPRFTLAPAVSVKPMEDGRRHLNLVQESSPEPVQAGEAAAPSGDTAGASFAHPAPAPSKSDGVLPWLGGAR